MPLTKTLHERFIPQRADPRHCTLAMFSTAQQPAPLSPEGLQIQSLKKHETIQSHLGKRMWIDKHCNYVTTATPVLFNSEERGKEKPCITSTQILKTPQSSRGSQSLDFIILNIKSQHFI